MGVSLLGREAGSVVAKFFIPASRVPQGFNKIVWWPLMCVCGRVQTEMLVCSLNLGKLWGLKLSVLTDWPVCHWLVGEGPFVHQDKEEIEKFLGAEKSWH